MRQESSPETAQTLQASRLLNRHLWTRQKLLGQPDTNLLQFFTRTSRMTALTCQFRNIFRRGATLAAKLLSFRGYTAASSMSTLLGGRHSSLLGFRLHTVAESKSKNLPRSRSTALKSILHPIILSRCPFLHTSRIKSRLGRIDI